MNPLKICLLLLLVAQSHALELYQPPEPIQWTMEPHAKASDVVKMAVAAPQVKAPVKYRFVCTSNDAHSSDWQTGNSHIVNGIRPETSLTFVAHAAVGGKAFGLPSKAITVTTQKAKGPGNTSVFDGSRCNCRA